MHDPKAAVKPVGEMQGQEVTKRPLIYIKADLLKVANINASQYSGEEKNCAALAKKRRQRRAGKP